MCFKLKYLPLNHPCFNQFFFSNILYTNKDTIHHISHKWAFKWQQFIPTKSLNSYSAFITLKVVPDSPAYVQKVTIFWHVKK